MKHNITETVITFWCYMIDRSIYLSIKFVGKVDIITIVSVKARDDLLDFHKYFPARQDKDIFS